MLHEETCQLGFDFFKSTLVPIHSVQLVDGDSELVDTYMEDRKPIRMLERFTI